MSKRLNIPLPIAGITNHTPSQTIPRGGVLDAHNIDIGDSGAFKRRGDVEVIDGCAGISCVFMSTTHDRLYFVANRYLYRVALNDLAAKTILATVAYGDGAFIESNGYVYYTEQNALYQIDSDGEISMGITPPSGAALLSFTPNGRLLKGEYHVICTSVDPITKRESGTSQQSTIILPADGGIAVDLTSMITDSNYFTNVYVTPIGSELFYLAHTVPPSLNTVIDRPPNGKRCTTLGESVLPGGSKIEVVAGRLFVVSRTWRLGVLSDIVVYSSPFNPLNTRLSYNYFVLTGRCRFIRRAEGILYVADDRGVWMINAQDVDNTSWTLVSQHIALTGSGRTLDSSSMPAALGTLPDTECVVWLSTIGAMVGLADGTVRSVHKNVALDSDIVVSAVSVVNSQFRTRQLIFSCDRTMI